MNEQTALDLRTKLSKYNSLKQRQQKLYALLKDLREKGKDPHYNASPFTGNTRESRNVDWLRIGFSKTLGGGDPIEIYLEDLMIDAYTFGNEIEAHLRKELDKLNEEIENL